jgi:hypothetical protein
MGYTIAAYPLTLLSASIKAMQAALVRLKDGAPCDDILVPFTEVSSISTTTIAVSAGHYAHLCCTVA